jgi:hypothetical protein
MDSSEAASSTSRPDLQELDELLSDYMTRALGAVPLEERIDAKVVFPSADEMAIRLVPLHALERLREAEADHHRVASVMWAAVGSLVGLITNAAFADGWPSQWALVLAGVLLTASIASLYLNVVTGRRATERRHAMFGRTT